MHSVVDQVVQILSDYIIEGQNQSIVTGSLELNIAKDSASTTNPIVSLSQGIITVPEPNFCNLLLLAGSSNCTNETIVVTKVSIF